jgi:hypothetical protein
MTSYRMDCPTSGRHIIAACHATLLWGLSSSRADSHAYACACVSVSVCCAVAMRVQVWPGARSACACWALADSDSSGGGGGGGGVAAAAGGGAPVLFIFGVRQTPAPLLGPSVLHAAFRRAVSCSTATCRFVSFRVASCRAVSSSYCSHHHHIRIIIRRVGVSIPSPIIASTTSGQSIPAVRTKTPFRAAVFLD